MNNLLKFLKGKSGPPDIGQEEEYDAEAEGTIEDVSEEEEEKKVLPKREKISELSASSFSGGSSGNLRLERINARLDSVVEWLHQFSERFSYINETLGEVKANSLATEKRLSKAMLEADKVVDVVREVKPEQLRIEYQKMDLRLAAINEKIEANKQLMIDAMNEVNEIRRQAEVFVGTDALMKLNNDTKKDVVETKKLSSRVKMQADKVQEIFLEVSRNFSETQKAMQQAEDVRESFEELKKEFEALKLSHSKLVSRDDLAKITRDSSKVVSDMNKVKIDYGKISQLAESTLEITQRNQEDIANIGVKVGDTGAKRISDYEGELDDVLGLISMLSEQVTDLKKRVGVGSDGEIARAVSEVVARRDRMMSVPPRRFPAPIPAPIPVRRAVPVKSSSSEIVSDIEPIPSPAPEVEKVEENFVSREEIVEPVQRIEPKKVEAKRAPVKSVVKKVPEKKKLQIPLPEPIEDKEVELKEPDEVDKEEGFLSKYKKLFD